MSQAEVPVPLDDLLAHRGWVRALARRLVSDECTADDVEQEVWLTAIRRPPSHAKSLRSWIARVVRSRAYDAHRREKRRQQKESTSPPGASSPSPDDVVARLEAHRKVVVALDELAEPYRKTLLLRYFEDLPVREVAVRLAVPLETVRTRLRRGHEMLRRRLDRDQGGDGRGWAVALLPLTGLDPGSPPSTGGLIPAAAALKAPATLLVTTVLVVIIGMASYQTFSGNSVTPVPEAPAAEPEAEAGPVPENARGDRSQMGDPAVHAARGGSERRPTESLPGVFGPCSVTARSLADGSPVVGLALRVAFAGREGIATCDSTGTCGLPDSGIRSIRPENKDWSMPPQTVAEIVESGTVWLYRTVAVTGTVRLEEGAPLLNLTTARLSVELDDRFLDTRSSFLPSGWTRLHSLPRLDSLPHPTIDGAFYVRVPAIHGATLIVRANGLCRDHSRIPLPKQGNGPVRIDLTLRAGPHISGVVRNADGQPLPDHFLLLTVTVHTTPGAVDAGRYPRPDCRARAGDGVILSYLERVYTSSDGTFDLVAPARGEVTIQAGPPPEHHPLRRRIGRIDRGDLRVDLRFEGAPASPRVRFFRGGKALLNGSIQLRRLESDGLINMSFRIPLDDNGSMSAALLRTGGPYVIEPPRWRAGRSSPHRRLLDWDGAKGVEIDELPEYRRSIDQSRSEKNRGDGEKEPK